MRQNSTFYGDRESLNRRTYNLNKYIHKQKPGFFNKPGFYVFDRFEMSYNYFELGIKIKSLLVSGLIGLAAGVIKRLFSLAEVLAIGEIAL